MENETHYYAQLDAQSIVVSVAQTGGELESADCIAIDTLDPGLIGKRYHPATGKFQEVPPDKSIPAAAIVSRLAFLSRFTDDEAIDIDLASIGATREAATVRRYLSKTNAAQHIDLADEETRGGVQALEAAGLIGAGRALEILDSPIQPKELP